MPIRHKGLMVILDGLGDRPHPTIDDRTPLEAARTPQLDNLAKRGLCGMVDPLAPGIPVSTHTGTGILFGLPAAHAARLSRGPIEAAGIGIDTQPGDILLRCNLATIQSDGDTLQVVDRRAGRIQEEHTVELLEGLSDVDLGGGIHASLRPATQHRCVLRMRGPVLSAHISDTDPGKVYTGANVARCHPTQQNDSAAVLTADAVNAFVLHAHAYLDKHPVNEQRRSAGLLPANGVLTRGAGRFNASRTLVAHCGLKAAVVSGEKTALGLARLFGFTPIDDPRFTALADTNIELKAAAALDALQQHDLVYLHIKGPDICAHDLDPMGKRDMLERIDAALAPLLMSSLVIGITGDHSTDSSSGMHTGDAVPSILFSPGGRRDAVSGFDESQCARGGLGRINAAGFVATLLDSMGALSSYKPGEAELYSL